MTVLIGVGVFSPIEKKLVKVIQMLHYPLWYCIRYAKRKHYVVMTLSTMEFVKRSDLDY